MLNAVISWSLRHRFLVVLAWIGVALLGLSSFDKLPLDAFPDTTPVQVQVSARAPALSAVAVERQVTAKMERALIGLPGAVEVRSLSRAGFSQVTVTFADGTDRSRARQVVGERIAEVTLPGGMDRPRLGPAATGLGEVFHYLVDGSASLAELRTIHDGLIAPQLGSVAGVAEINAWGGDERRVDVVVDPVELAKRGLTLSELAEAIERENASVGAGAHGIDPTGEASLIQGMALVTDRSDLEQIAVRTEAGAPIRIRDVAQVVDGRALRHGAVTANGRGEVVLGLGFMLVGENGREVTRRLDARLEEIRKTLPAGITVTPVHRRTDLVDKVLHTVERNLFEGALLVIAVLFLFLGSVRAGLIVACAIPLSMLVAFDLMLRAGVAGSLMSLGAIDFGLLVDSSVITVENAVTRLGEGSARSRVDVVRDAAVEVRKPTVVGELIIIVVYLPILLLEGIEGKLFRPMALTVIFALVGSMLLSVTLMPVLASLVLPARRRRGEGLVMRLVGRGYRPVLDLALRFRWGVLALAALLLANAAFLATRLGAEFVPRLQEGTIVINTVRLASVSLDESVRSGLALERALLEKFPHEVERVWTRTGSAEVATDPMGVELSDVFVALTPAHTWRRAKTQGELVRLMEEELGVLPGMRLVFTQPIEMRVNEMIAGIRADVGVKVFGDDLELLRVKAQEIAAVLAHVPGAADVTTEQVTGQPILEARVDREAAFRLGVTAADVLSQVEAVGGIPVGELTEGERRFPIALRFDDESGDPEALGRSLLSTRSGQRIPLGRVADFETTWAPAAVNREWGKRRVVVQANVRGRDLGSFVAEAMRAVGKVDLPAGTYVRFGGNFEHLQRAKKRLMVVVPVALVLVLVLLGLTYGRARDAFRVATGVPLAAVGGIVALWLRGIPFSISAGIGFVALSGIAVLGDMVLVSTVRQLIDAGIPEIDAVRQAAHRRLRPVLMTALVASVGFLPMALATGVGAEVQRPLATVVIGGVLSSTLLTLLVLPVLYTLLGPRARPSA